MLGLSKSWGGGVRTLDIGHSVHRLSRLLWLFSWALRSHIALIPFLIVIFHLFPTSYPSVAVPIWSHINIHPLPTSYPGTNRRPPGRCPHPPPSSLCRSPFAPWRVPVSAAVPIWVHSLFLRPWPAPRSLSAPEGFPQYFMYEKLGMVMPLFNLYFTKSQTYLYFSDIIIYNVYLMFVTN